MPVILHSREFSRRLGPAHLARRSFVSLDRRPWRLAIAAAPGAEATPSFEQPTAGPSVSGVRRRHASRYGATEAVAEAAEVEGVDRPVGVDVQVVDVRRLAAGGPEGGAELAEVEGVDRAVAADVAVEA